MAWNKQLETSVKAVGGVRVSVTIGKKGKAVLAVLLSNDVMETLEKPTCANAWLGDGDDAGKMLIQFDADGALPVKEWPKGGAGIRVRLPADFIQQSVRAIFAPHELLQAEDGVRQIVLEIPRALVRTKLAAA